MEAVGEREILARRWPVCSPRWIRGSGMVAEAVLCGFLRLMFHSASVKVK
jgi:hypothetical protein